MAFCDFVVKFDPEKDSLSYLTEKILYSIWVGRIKSKKPVVIFIGADSGEGKTYTVAKLQEILLKVQGINDIKPYVKAMNVFTPLEYGEKLDKILFDKDLKKVNILGIHDARELVRAKQWFSFLNQSVGDVNALSRSVKRLIFFIVSQFIKDIDTTIRYTLNYYCTVRRPKHKPARLYIHVMWKDDRDLEKPKLRKRKLSGYLVYPNGRYRRFVPQYLELSKPSKEVIDIIETEDRNAKVGIIRKKIDKLVSELKSEIGQDNKKVSTMIDWYLKHPDSLNKIGRQYRGKWKLRPEARDMHDLTLGESEEFEQKLNESLKNKGVIENEKPE